ncbi:RspH10B [Paenibacillus mucilaginosus 3016]|uniref:RspH10B n=1 Tax=Paenibacillus mucilaginosus 3016 TaxID=1116391 RepID=H6NKR7_9BACL|nr:stalk domain-containing protein [Paenibacillus mucilaginosus]AFC33204.1 RspH10B [Paenibacillus mucilaginosus 3016]WFA21636.1 hypothetical protein ERY13_32730 [Paenibacillus mucilaginosus]
MAFGHRLLSLILASAVGLTAALPSAWAENSVIEDDNLEALVRDQLDMPSGNLTKEDLLELTSLYSYRGEDIHSLKGLEYAVNLHTLVLDGNPIEDFTPIASLKKLEMLALQKTGIKDLSPLSGLPSLTKLLLDANGIEDLSPLSGVSTLTDLLISKNSISDLRPLEHLPLNWLIISENRITDITPLGSSKTLDHLYLSDNAVEEISPLLSIDTLEQADLSGNPLNAASAEVVNSLKSRGVEVTLSPDAPVGSAESGAVASDISIYLDHMELEFDHAPVILEGSTLVPFRSLFEQLGLTVAWDGATRTVTGSRDRFKLTLQIDNPQAIVNGKAVELAVAPKLLEGSTYVPLRFVGEATGRDVEWLDHIRTVFIRSTPASLIYETLYSNQIVYEGETENGLPQGSGKYLHDGKLWYEGTFVQGAMEGSGKLTDPYNKSVYEGGFQQNLMQGQGKLVYGDGSYYVGGFDRGKRQGSGKLYFADGTTAFEGNFDNDGRSGEGTQYFQNGSKIVGPFSNDALFGQVKEYSNGELIYEGEHKGSIRNGPGIEYSGGVVVYRGDFEDGYRYGNGELYIEGKLHYKGKFYYGQPNGAGMFYFPSGKVQFEGKVTDGDLSGEGTLFFDDGSFYIGEVFRGKPDGQGILYDATGKTVSEGLFFDGTYITDTFATEKTEAYKKRLVEKSLDYYVVDGLQEDDLWDFGLTPQQAVMMIDLAREPELEAFKSLSEAAKKELLNDYVQRHWGELPGVNQCFVLVYHGPLLYAYTETGHQKKSSELKLNYFPEGKASDDLGPVTSLWTSSPEDQ